MKINLFIVSLLVMVFFLCSRAKMSQNTEESMPAQTPPMGWNSFDSYGVYLHEKAALENLEAFAVKLKPHGYEYFVIDAGWFGEFKLQEGTIPAEKHASKVNLMVACCNLLIPISQRLKPLSTIAINWVKIRITLIVEFQGR